MSHLGDLWDLGGVDGPAVLGRGHSVPGLFSLHALISLFSLISWIYRAKGTHKQGNLKVVQWKFCDIYSLSESNERGCQSDISDCDCDT